MRKSYVLVKTCFGCSKEPSHLDGSCKYQQHMFWLKMKKILCNSILMPAYDVQPSKHQGTGY